jgi:hypothetical protein
MLHLLPLSDLVSGDFRERPRRAHTLGPPPRSRASSIRRFPSWSHLISIVTLGSEQRSLLPPLAGHLTLHAYALLAVPLPGLRYPFRRPGCGSMGAG